MCLLPRKGNRMKLEATTWREGRDWASHFDCWAGRKPWTFPVLARPLKGSSLFYNKSKFYTLSELIWIGFGEKSIAPAEVHWLQWKTGSFPHVKRRWTVGAIVRDRQNSTVQRKLYPHFSAKTLHDIHNSKLWMTGGRKSEEELVSWFLMLQSPDRLCECTFCAFAWKRCSAALWLTTEPSSVSGRCHCLLFRLPDTFC